MSFCSEPGGLGDGVVSRQPAAGPRGDMKRTVEIAGGGIAGLTAGLAFAQKGWRVRVHEQDPAPRRFGAGMYIWENGLRVLDALGVLPRVIDGVIPATRQEKRNADGKTFASSRIGGDLRLYVPLRETLVTALHDALLETGGAVVFGSRAIAAEPEGVLHFADGGRASADLVIGADGINSAVRDSLGLLRWRRAAGQFGYRALIRRTPDEAANDRDPPHCEHWNGSRRLLYAPATRELAYVQLTSLGGDTAANAVPIDRGFWRALFPDLASIVDRIPDDGRGDWFEHIRLKRWSLGRVAIVGDAASAQLPFLGQGGGCSMTSAYVLARMVDRAADMRDGIAEWELRERPITQWVQSVADWYGRLARLRPEVRTAVFGAVDAIEWVKRRTLLAAACRDATTLPSRPVDVMAEATMHFLVH
jgi:2-polyprenyl-6-methoxyphenol hydroxylase-like FAD-dependent oxidoreductase